MTLKIPHHSHGPEVLSDTITRLNIIYPSCKFQINETHVIINSLEHKIPPGLQETVSDQLLKSKNAHNTSDLRELLYRKLLD